MPLHTRLDAVLAAGLARPAYRGRASLPTGMQPSESMEVKNDAEAAWELLKLLSEVKAAERKLEARATAVGAMQVEVGNAISDLRHAQRHL